MNGSTSELQQWVVGLVAGNGHYLTQEKFGFKVNASGTSMRVKQTWTLLQEPGSEVVYIRSHLGRYLSAERRGGVTCEEEEQTPDTRFLMEFASDGSGRWCFRSAAHNTYLRAGNEELTCNEKKPSAMEMFTPHLGIHPQVNMRHLTRKKYVHLSDNELHCDELIPWGADSLVTLDFNGSNYMIKACDGRFLQADGSLSPSLTEEAKFSLEIRSGEKAQGLAFRNVASSSYLTSSGFQGLLKCVRKTVTRDELFTLEDSAPQVSLIAPNGKKVSIRQGVDVSANQTQEVEDTEIFQMEYDSMAKAYSFRTCKNLFWTLSGPGVQASASEQSKLTKFQVQFRQDGGVDLVASNGQFLGAKPTGQLHPVSEKPGPFYLTLLNRPLLVLKSEFGFIGYKTASSRKLECNKSVWDTLNLEPADQPGMYWIKGKERYVQVSDDGVSADGEAPTSWVLELEQRTRLALLLPGRGYLKGEQNGHLSLSQERSKACLWEY